MGLFLTDSVRFQGPCADSVFARDCRDCTFHAVCQQWRTRDCTDCKLSLWCPNEPVIEGCTGMGATNLLAF
jgi:hypothetical protein